MRTWATEADVRGYKAPAWPREVGFESVAPVWSREEGVRGHRAPAWSREAGVRGYRAPAWSRAVGVKGHSRRWISRGNS